jgi:Zn-dependent M28 family amino/carboxypeptidase
MARRAYLVCAVVGILLASSAVLGAPTPQDVVDDVSLWSYTNFLNNSLYTHNGNNRGNGANHDQARTNIFNAFQGAGLTTTLDSFTYSGGTYYNVVGIKPGTVHPNDIYIVGAHFDSVNNPGADDNASGTAGVVAAARAMSGFQFEDTLIFISFDREEQGLIGSNAWATAHAGDNIKGMISLDMIAYNPAGYSNTALLYGRTDPIQTAMVDALATYAGITASKDGVIDASDHAPFEWQGKPACLLIEGAVWSNPYYHTQSDSVDTPNYIDYDYAARMTMATVGFLAENAVVVPEPVSLVSLAIGFGALLLKRRQAA